MDTTAIEAQIRQAINQYVGARKAERGARPRGRRRLAQAEGERPARGVPEGSRPVRHRDVDVRAAHLDLGADRARDDGGQPGFFGSFW